MPVGQKPSYIALPEWLRNLIQAGKSNLPPVPTDSTMGSAPGIGPGPGTPLGTQPPMPPPPPMTYGQQEQGVDAMRRAMLFNMPAAIGHGMLGGNAPGTGAAWDIAGAGWDELTNQSVVKDPNDPWAGYHASLRGRKEGRGLQGDAGPMASNQTPLESGLDYLTIASMAPGGLKGAASFLKGIDVIPGMAAARYGKGNVPLGGAMGAAQAATNEAEFMARFEKIARQHGMNQDILSQAIHQFVNTHPEMQKAGPETTGLVARQMFMRVMKDLQAKGIHVPMSEYGMAEDLGKNMASIDAERAQRLQALEALAKSKQEVPAAIPPSEGAFGGGMTENDLKKILGEDSLTPAAARADAILGTGATSAGGASPIPSSAARRVEQIVTGVSPRGHVTVTGEEPNALEKLIVGVERDKATLEHKAGNATTELPVSPVPMPAATPPPPRPEPVARYDAATDKFSLPPNLQGHVEVRSRIGVDQNGKEKRYWEVIFKDPNKGNILATSTPIDTAQGVVGRIEGITSGTQGFNVKEWNLRPGTSPSDANDLNRFFMERAKRAPVSANPGAGKQEKFYSINDGQVRLPVAGVQALLEKTKGMDPVSAKAEVMAFLRDPAHGLNVPQQEAAAQAILSKVTGPKQPAKVPYQVAGNKEFPVPPRAPQEPGEQLKHYVFGGENGVRLPAHEVDAVMERAVAKGNEKQATNVFRFYLEKAKNITQEEKAVVLDRLLSVWREKKLEAGGGVKPPPSVGAPSPRLPNAGPRPTAPAPVEPLQATTAISQSGEGEFYKIGNRRVSVATIDKLMENPDLLAATSQFGQVLKQMGITDTQELANNLARFAQRHQLKHNVVKNPTGAIPGAPSSPVGVPSMAGKPAQFFNPNKATTTDILNELGGGGDNIDRPWSWYQNNLETLTSGGMSVDQANKEIGWIIRRAKNQLRMTGDQITRMSIEQLREALSVNRVLPKAGK